MSEPISHLPIPQTDPVEKTYTPALLLKVSGISTLYYVHANLVELFWMYYEIKNKSPEFHKQLFFSSKSSDNAKVNS